jgi:excisionase family DNA binding protein
VGETVGRAEGPQPAYHLRMLTVAEIVDRVGKNHETIRRWIRSGRLPVRRVGHRHAIEDQDLRSIEAELPDDWQVGDDGKLAPNWVAALHRSRSGH